MFGGRIMDIQVFIKWQWCDNLKALCKTSLGSIGIVVLSLVGLFETHFPQNIQQ